MTEQPQDTKVCTRCGAEYPLSEFRVFVDKRYGLRRRPWCSMCRNFTEQARKERQRKQKPTVIRAKEREKARRYREQHTEQYNAYHRAYKAKAKRKKFEQMLGITNSSERTNSL